VDLQFLSVPLQAHAWLGPTDKSFPARSATASARRAAWPGEDLRRRKAKLKQARGVLKAGEERA
jgi:hypothetical protein